MKQLKKLVLHKTTPLTVPQMKHITGGYEGDGYFEIEGSCCYFDAFHQCTECGVSKTLALTYINEGVASRYCCDSCYEASWIGNTCYQ